MQYDTATMHALRRISKHKKLYQRYSTAAAIIKFLTEAGMQLRLTAAGGAPDLPISCQRLL